MKEYEARAVSSAIIRPVNNFAIWIKDRASESTTGEELAVWMFVANRLGEMTDELEENLKQLKNQYTE